MVSDDWTFHGGRLDRARMVYADAPRPWIDLSTGINPHGWDAGLAGPIDWRALPDPQALGRLEAAAAACFGAAPDRVRALPGTEIGLRLLPALGLPAPFRHVEPGYRTHGDALAGSIAMSADALDQEAACGGTILLANPNNPDGGILPPATLVDLARRMAGKGGWLVVDEAFADACPEAGILPMLDADLPVIVLRSFGKYFGLAGLRLGFMIAPPAMLERLDRRLGSWPVSAAAIAIGTAAYRDAAWIADTRRRLRADADALDALLARHGLEGRGACPLFRLIETDDAPALFERLARQGILTRPFDYQPRWLRLGLPADAAAFDRLDRALAHG
ncbi:threonine-phosphate decarboxylase CobD [Sphingomonas fennica]|uniref:threonine-phosphate decarboxylase n=1 Tax=Edaphosphingomonas fennica TaxID=114404 RepID=A0A2T4HRV4_9SPHN|nr:threonine-phosphate decarboxylase CobD [Sphingomonas fennica]PTD18533.1 threonine-phosphate decarboxylase [Sphingomonas fennica]